MVVRFAGLAVVLLAGCTDEYPDHVVGPTHFEVQDPALLSVVEQTLAQVQPVVPHALTVALAKAPMQESMHQSAEWLWTVRFVPQGFVLSNGQEVCTDLNGNGAPERVAAQDQADFSINIGPCAASAEGSTVHELGHVFGLQHDSSKGSPMAFPRNQSTRFTTVDLQIIGGFYGQESTH